VPIALNKFLRGAIAASVVILLPAFAPGRSAAASYCAAADSHSAALMDFVKTMMTSPDEAANRTALRVALSTSGKVSLVTTNSTCQRGMVVLDSVFKMPATGLPVYMIKVDSFFAVAHKGTPTNTDVALMFLDSKYRFRGVMRAPWY
jgi:hypothetical protein